MKEEVPLLEFNDVSLEFRGLMVPIRLKLSDQGVAYKNVKTGKLDHISPSDIDLVNWQRLAGGHGVRIFTSNGSLYRFGGFKETDQNKLEKCFRSMCGKEMSVMELSVKGWNYGATKFNGGVLSFDVASVPAFEIPISSVSGCVTGKNEVTLEFHQNDDAAVSLMEMRFHIPSSELAGEDPVDAFQQRVMSKASVITATGESLALFHQLQCLTPRGRYDMKIFPSFIQLHGKTFDFKIPIESVLRLFLLPHIDGRQHFFVVSLDPPIKQGQTRYPYLILLFPGDETNQIELPLSEEELSDKFGGRLEKEISGYQFEIISRLFKGVCNRKIVTPGAFLGHSGTPAISCSYKAAAGYLYPLERGFIYVHKPPIHIRFDELTVINFARSGSTTRSFDFEIECRNGTMHTFSSIDKGEYHKLYDYVTSKKLKIKNRSKTDTISSKDAFSDSDADEPDHYMNRVRAEAKERADDGADDDDSESEDSDFNPGEEGSDVAEEYDSNASGSSSDESGEEDGERSKEMKVKKSKKKTVSEKPRKKKKEKDENKPKRPQSAYFLWLNENRESIKRKNPGISITEISKKAGEMWRELKDKSEWDEKAVVAKKAYEVAMKEYKASGGMSSSNVKSKESKSSSKTSSSSSSKKQLISPQKFKSKEYIEDDDSSSSSADSEDEPLNKLKSPKKKDDSREEEEEMSEDKEDESSNSGDSD